MSMKRSTIVWAAALAFAAVGQANAADMYRAQEGGYKDAPAYATVNWAGFYAGINGGYGWSARSEDSTITDVLNATPPVVTNVPVNAPNPRGGFGGGQIGYNWQKDHLVIGVEADIQAAGIEGSASSSFPGGGPLCGYDYTAKRSMDYFGTLRGRVGYATDSTLAYATGGFAYGDAKYNGAATFSAGGGCTAGQAAFAFNKSGVETGYAVGGGLEHKITPAWSIKAEYQYINLGAVTLNNVYFGWPDYSNSLKVENDFHTVRIGLNYHVGQGYEPLK